MGFTHLALVKVIDDLLVKLVLELSLCGCTVVVSLGQVGSTRFIWPLQRESGTEVNGVQYSPEGKVNGLQAINCWLITDANVCEIDEKSYLNLTWPLTGQNGNLEQRQSIHIGAESALQNGAIKGLFWIQIRGWGGAVWTVGLEMGKTFPPDMEGQGAPGLEHLHINQIRFSLLTPGRSVTPASAVRCELNCRNHWGSISP